MEQKKTTRVITIKDLWQIFVYRLWIMLLAAAIAVSAFLVFNILTYTPRYSSTATMYILRQANENISSGDISSDLSVALKVVNDCDFLLKSDTVINAVDKKLNLGEEYSDLKKNISTNNPSNTRILQITVEADSPEMAKKIVDTLCEIGAESINDAMGFNQVNLYEYGTLDNEPCNQTPALIYILWGGVVAVIVYAIFLVMFIMDDTLTTDEDCQMYLGLSVIGDIPDADEVNKKKYGGYYRGYYRRYGNKYGGRYGSKYGYRSKYKTPYQANVNSTTEAGKEETK